MIPSQSQRFAAFGLLLLYASLSTSWINERPALEVRDGNLFITSAWGKNITLLSRGSNNINVNGINLLQIATLANDASQLVETWRSGRLADMEGTLSRLTEAIEGPSGLQGRVIAIESKTNPTSQSGNTGGRPSPWDDGMAKLQVEQVLGRLLMVENRLDALQEALQVNDCVSDPCQNGGTCEAIFIGFRCRCMEGWEGAQCDVDVDECSRYAGTDLGCQNGATCRNLRGTYRCDCADGFKGIHCTRRSNDCNNENSNELCGQGTCVNKPGSALGYTCICEQGWQAEGTNPACIKDVDECAGKHPPCSFSPMVPCINVPGTFYCGGCPAGYTGNGYYCADIDECAINNGGCSTAPTVQCINTIGSRICGSCPSGYQGDGVTCSYVGVCTYNNGGCHRLATCIDNPGLGNLRVQCRCPQGYDGDGMGPNGCIFSNVNRGIGCSNNPCVHGTCTPVGDHYACLCESGYTGTHCNVLVNVCDPNPCRNGGVCSISAARTPVCRCTSNFSGPRCATARQSCGGIIADSAGILQFPISGNTYPHGLSCAWILNTDSSSVLNVTFTAFNLEQSTDCKFDFLQVHDGRTAGEHIIGKYCGNSLPAGGNIVSTHNYLYLWFHSDNSVARDGFTLQWNSIAPLCGGEINSDYGTLRSPGSPGRYPVNRDCYWHISVTPGKYIQFNFFSVLLEEHPTCEYDYLEVRDGPSNSSKQLGIFCNHTQPPPLETTGSEAWLHFHSDNSGQDAGFQLTFSSKGREGCWGVYRDPSGRITSPNFGSDYEPNLECEWKIEVLLGERVKITWDDFKLEYSRSCDYDFVEVYDGANREAPLVGRYCGSSAPPNIISNSNSLLIRFKSDASYSRQGFKLNYEVWCGGEFTEASGLIKSPYYPNPYPASRTCIYEVIQPLGKAIQLTINDLDIETSYSSDCRYDYLEIRDGDNENASKIGTYCGGNSSIPEFPIMSTHNYLWLKFKTDSTVHSRGFMITYQTVDRRCGGLLKERSGQFQTPSDVGGRYGNGEDCTWLIQAPPGYIIQLSWLTFDLEYQSSCRHDFIKITENITASSERDMGTYCGSTKPPVLTTQSPIMTVKFHTDNSVTKEGFAAAYVFLDASQICGGLFHTLTGVILSPNYPDHYPSYKDCEWIIQAPNNHQVALNVKTFNIEKDDTCDYDYLEIRNGGSSSSPLMGKYCGVNITSPIISFGNQIYVKFHSDFSGSQDGFNIEWDSTTIGCGGSLTTTSGSISSPNYPQPYGYSTECTWNIRVSAGSAIEFVISDLELEVNDRCDYDFIEIYDGPPTRHKKLGRYCQSNQMRYLHTTSNFASVRFRSDATHSSRGFHMNYHTLCHQKIRGFRGVIESPNFPNQYPNRENCSWIIEAPKGNKLNLTFTHFDLEAGEQGSCSNDYLEIKEGGNDTPNKYIGKYCDSTELPPRVASTQNQLFLEFYSDIFYVNNGFRLEWVVNGCGGVLNRPEGTITSPGYPIEYPPNIECEWLIEVDYAHSIEITLLKIDLETRSSCSNDKVTVYSGDNTTALKLTELCHTNVSKTLTSTGNKMFVKFEADNSHQGSGFIATYKSVDIQCGGRFTVSNGVIHSTGYPQNYPSQQNCEWLIQVPVNHLVNLTFNDFDIEDSSNCTYDYVRIYDGSTKDAPLLGSHCDNTLPPSYTSTSNEMLVVMRTDSSITAKGFMATYNLACGARIVTSDQGILTMDPAVGTQEKIENCTWTIVAQDPGDHVTLILTELQTPSSHFGPTGCWVRSIQIFEGEDTHGPLLGTWCNTKVPPPITSQGNALTVHASAAWGGLHSNKFSGIYSVLSSACGGDYTSEHGTIATPGYPNSYPRNVECIWKIRSSPGNRLSLSFTEFDLFESEHCNLDYVEVREENGAGKLIGLYCGKNIETLTWPKSLWIKFRSSADDTKKGFVAEYSMLHGGELSGPSGEIASPLYPKPCLRDTSYYWRITVDDPMSSIKITFKDFHIGKFTDICYITMTIYDGYDQNAPKLMDKCGTTLPESVRSTSNVVYIKFTSSLVSEGTWFLLDWLQVPREPSDGEVIISNAECNEIISLAHPGNSSYTFNSPGWPTGYANDLDCSWTFESIPGTHLVLKFLTLDLDESEGCYSDHVNVFSGNSLTSQNDWTQIGTFCLRNATRTSVTSISELMKVNFVSDVYYNKTGFQATVKKVCGGQLYGPNGVIEVNNTNNYIPITCQWNVTVRPGRTIGVKFSSMAITGTNPTCSNYLMLKNGGSASSPVLGAGKYCGSEIPDALQTTGNQLYVKLSGIQYYVKFKLMYREVGMDCGGEIVLSKTTKTWEINSPNYPNIPSPHSECFWTIMAPAGEQIMIDFLDRFDLTPSSTCDSEYLEVRDGGTDTSELLGRFCKAKPSSMTTTGNFMYVHFYTDILEPKNGFKARVSIGDTCGGTIRTSRGVLRSPNYPTPYPSNVNCTWNIIGPDMHYMKLEFQEIDLPSRIDCGSSDHVEISDLVQYNDTEDHVVRRIGKYCGRTKPGVIESSGNLVQVTFKSDNFHPYSYKGFNINFTTPVAKCGGSLVASAGIFSSPGYPNIRTHVGYCTWRITVLEGYRVQVNLLDFDLGVGSTQTTWPPTPSLSFYNDFHFGTLIKDLRSNDTDRQVSSVANTMMILYASHSNLHRGFKARYISIPALCGGTAVSDQGTLISGQNSVFNMTTFDCIWSVKSPWNDATSQTLALNVSGVLDGNRLTSLFCQHRATYISIRDERNVYLYVCGSLSTGVTVRSSSRIVKITALKRSVTWRQRRGITNVTINYRWHRCGGLLSGPSHTISAPANVTYPIDCIWEAKIPYNERIQFAVNKLNLGNCMRNYILIRIGNRNSPRVVTFCGNITTHLATPSNELSIEYHAEDSNNEFEIQLDTVESGCGGTMRGKGTIFSSPGFPTQYPNNAECEWYIRVEVGYHIGLVFIDRFNMETSDNCANDFVEISDWRTNATTGEPEFFNETKFCGRNLPPTMNSTSNVMRVLFRSNSQIQGDGFRAKWNINCGGVFTVSKTAQTLVSPGRLRYGRNRHCNYTFLAPGKKIIIKFTEFQLENSGVGGICQYENVSILANRRTGATASVWCGTNIPPMQRADSRLELHFKTTRYFNRRGFTLTYYLDECGGEINAPADISSPAIDDGGSYYERINCTWVVRAPPGKAVVLRFQSFHLEYNQECLFDYVNVYSGLIIQKEHRLASLCGAINDHLPAVKSENGSMVINFVTDRTGNFGGFTAKVLFTTGEAEGCGGKIQVFNSQTFRTQRGSTYQSLEDCHWLFEAPVDNVIRLRISSMDLKNVTSTEGDNQTKSCTGDYLEIRNGLGPFSELIGKYCGNVTPPAIVTSGNYMWIRFVTDGTLNGNGVTATVEPVPSSCGNSTLMVGNRTEILTSPGYPGAYAAGLRCRWKVMFLDEAERYHSLTVHFVEFDLENSENCNEDKLTIASSYGENFVSEGFGQNFVFSGTASRPTYTWLSPRETRETFVYCGNGIPVDFHSSSGEIILSFQSSHNPKTSRRAGFKLEYSASHCNRNYTGAQGRIFHQNITDCWFTITASVGRTISLYFHDFAMYSSSGCADVGLKVYDGDSSGTSLESVCGVTLPNPIFSSGNKLSFHSWSRQPSQYDFYDMTYTTTDKGKGCGGELYNYNGRFTSPLYPGPYRNVSECTWKVSVPSGFIVKLDFVVFDIGTRAICETDNLQISDISNEGTVSSTKTYCGEDNPAEHVSTQGQVSVTYRTSVNNGGAGWIITFEAQRYV